MNEEACRSGAPLAIGEEGIRAVRPAGPVRCRIGWVVEHVFVEMRAKTHLMRAVIAEGPPDALDVGIGPVGAVEPCDAAIGREARAGRYAVRAALQVVQHIIVRDGYVPVERTLGVGLQRKRIAEMLLAKAVIVAGEARDAAEGRSAGGRTGEISLHARPGIVVPVADRIGRGKPWRDVPGDPAVDIGHLRMEQPAGPDDIGRLAKPVDGAESAERAGWKSRVGYIGERLAVAVLEIARDQPGHVIVAVADEGAGIVGAKRLVCAELLEGLEGLRLLDVGLERVRHAGGDLHYAAYGISGIKRGERAIEHIDARDLLGCDQPPARRADRVVVGDQRGEQEIIRIDETACACIYPRGAGRERCLRVAIVAFAQEKARQVFERVLRVDDIDAPVCHSRRYALRGLRKLVALLDGRRAEHRGEGSRDIDFGEFFDRSGLCVGYLTG